MKNIFKIFILVFISINGLYSQNKPNIIWINADDLGVELGCYGNPDVKTPNIDKLASQGVLYSKAYATAPICSSSRSALITGMYPSSVNSQDHRTINMTNLPDGIEPITAYFKKAGYFCTNGKGTINSKGGKQDFNFLDVPVFDGTDWSQRADNQPFFAQIQIKEPHRPFVKDPKNPIDYTKVTLPACYPNYPILKADWALYLESIQECDRQVGAVLERLEKEGLAENTIVFFFGDNGRPHLRDKQFLYEGGLHVPLIVRYPTHLKEGKKDHQLVNLIDVAATSLELAKITVPSHMQGNVFLGKNASKRKYAYGFRQRAGDAPENMRSITDGRYKLIWNRTTDRSWMQLSSYKKMEYPDYSLYQVLDKKGAFKAPFNQIMASTKPEFELFDLKKDPMEFTNLSETRRYKKVKNKLSNVLMSNMVTFEKNMISESTSTIESAKKSSAIYYKKGIKDLNPTFDENTSDEVLLKYWEDKLLKK